MAATSLVASFLILSVSGTFAVRLLPGHAIRGLSKTPLDHGRAARRRSSHRTRIHLFTHPVTKGFQLTLDGLEIREQLVGLFAIR